MATILSTVNERMRMMAEDVRGLLRELLLNHTEIYRWNVPNDFTIVLSPRGDYGYRSLSIEARQVQSHLLHKFRLYRVQMEFLLTLQSRVAFAEFKEADMILEHTVELQRTHCKSVQKAFEEASNALDAQLELLDHLYDGSADTIMLVPDTNALLKNPNLETWRFDGLSQITLILVPTVLSELDKFKVFHRSKDVVDKSNSLIRRIKEYFRRGDIHEGVPLDKSAIMLRTTPIEPNGESFLPWMDANNNDDRFLASTLEIMRANSRSRIAIVTTDVNMQNKARYAAIPYLEPPEPSTTPEASMDLDNS